MGRQITLRAFKIKQTQLSMSDHNVFLDLENRLGATKAGERVMRLNQDDETKESDLISGFSAKKENIFATMMRIMPDADDTHINDDLMTLPSFSVDELRKTANNAAAVYKNHYYICLNNAFLITNLSRTTTIKRVENYLNWLLKTHTFELTPLVTPPPDLKLSELTNIKFATHPATTSKKNNAPDVPQDKKIPLVYKFLKDFFNELFIDSNALKDIDLDQVVSAELLLKLKKPRKMSDEEFQRTFGAFLKPVSDQENITLRDTKGNKITGADILKTKLVSVEKTDKNFISEPDLHIEMARFLDELAR